MLANRRTLLRLSLRTALLASAVLAVPDCLRAAGGARVVRVATWSELERAATEARPGTTVRIAPGRYGNLRLADLRGTREAPIVIEGEDPKSPPVIDCATHRKKEGINLLRCSWVTVRHVRIVGARVNGVQVADDRRYGARDDHAAREAGRSAAHHVLLDHVTVFDTGPRGNYDAFKLTFTDYVTIRNCHAEGWGGSGIDHYGGRYGLYERNRFIGKQGFTQTMGINVKGYANDTLIRWNYFENAVPGQQAINIGGPHDRGPGTYECRRLAVAGNVFVGGAAPVAWMGDDGSRFHHNTVIFPTKRFLRFGQRMEFDGGTMDHNLFVFDGRRMKPMPMTVAGNLTPKSVLKKFRFSRNAWFDAGNRGFRPAFLPTPEADGVYGVDPKLSATKGLDIKVTSDDERLKDIGASAYRGKPMDWHPGPPKK